MNGRVTFVVSVVLICAAIGSAGEVKWKGGGSENLWSTAGNWEGGKVPGPHDVVVLNPPPQRGPVITSDIQCGEIRGPVWKSSEPQVVDVIGCNVIIEGWWKWANGGSGEATINIKRANVDIRGMFRLSDGGKTYGAVNITDSTVKCKGIMIGDGGNGEINLDGNVLLEVDDSVNMGGSAGDNQRSYEDKPLRITMNGGIFRIGGTLMCPSNNRGRAGKASIKLTAGSLQCKKFSHADLAYSMDIEEGQFVVSGDVTADIKKDIASGYITAFGGKDTVTCRYISRSNRTIVMASSPKKARRPSPRNREENVRPDVKLTWRGGGKSYNVYLGTSLDAVGAGAKAYKEGLNQTTFDPVVLEFGKTYYWRVDSIDEAGVLQSGVTWQFRTTDGKAFEPSPATKSERAAVDVSLSWKPGLTATSHKAYFGSEPGSLASVEGIKGNSFQPKGLKLGKTYYWRVDAVNEAWKQSPWKGDVWSFTVDSGKAENPQPVDKAQWMPLSVKLSWEAAKTSTAHTVYLSDKLDDVKNGVKPVSKGQKETSYTVSSLKESTAYYWRVDEVSSGEVIKGDIWQFSTEGILDLKVDLAIPQWEDRSKPRPGTAKPGWIIWASERWADMYMHNGAWFPSKDAGASASKEGVVGSGVQFYMDNGKGGNGTVMAHGMCRGGLGGDLPPYGEAEGDPIANTYFFSCDWAGQKNGDCFLMIRGLPAGEYEMTSYHNHWEPCTQQTRNCHSCESGMPPMPSVTANPVPAVALPGYRSWSFPKGTGTGVIALENAKNIKVSSVLSDEKVSKSFIRFATDGSDVLIIYEAPDNSYPDRARKGREGARGILNAFELKLVSWAKKGR